jgi:hypothetical protein
MKSAAHWGLTLPVSKPTEISTMSGKTFTVTDEIIVTLEKSRLPEPPRECHYQLAMMLEPLKRKRIELVTPFKVPATFLSIECEDTTARCGVSKTIGQTVYIWASIGPDATQPVPCIIKALTHEWVTAMRLEQN